MNLHETYSRIIYRKYVMLLGVGILTVSVAIISIMYATNWHMIGQGIVSIYQDWAGYTDGGALSLDSEIVFYLRLPRVGMAIIAGFGLALSGGAMQSVTRNYLVSPFTIGISSAAAFGASIGIVFLQAYDRMGDVGIVLYAFISSMLCLVLVYTMVSYLSITPGNIVLVGIALNYLFSAGSSMVRYFAQGHQLEALVQWAFGSCSKATWSSLFLIVPMVMMGSIIIQRFAMQMNAISMNDDETVGSLGIRAEYIRGMVSVCAVLMTASIISFTGVIGFVGLIAPHLARMLIGNDHHFYLPMTGVLGAFLLVVSDFLGREVLYPLDIPVGVVLSFVGVPMFIHLIIQSRKRGA